MTPSTDAYNPISFRELSAWLGAAGAPAEVEVNFEVLDRRGTPDTLQVLATRQLLTAWAQLAFGMDTLGLRYAESRRDTGLADAGGVLTLARDEEAQRLLIGWESGSGQRAALMPAEYLIQGIADACRDRLPSIQLNAKDSQDQVVTSSRERPSSR